MQKHQAITGVIKPRYHHNRHPACSKTGLLIGIRVRLIPLWRIPKNNGNSGEWALGGADKRSKLLLRAIGIMWCGWRVGMFKRKTERHKQ